MIFIIAAMLWAFPVFAQDAHLDNIHQMEQQWRAIKAQERQKVDDLNRALAAKAKDDREKAAIKPHKPK